MVATPTGIKTFRRNNFAIKIEKEEDQSELQYNKNKKRWGSVGMRHYST